MHPKEVTTAAGISRWACGECGLSHAREGAAAECCMDAQTLVEGVEMPLKLNTDALRFRDPFPQPGGIIFVDDVPTNPNVPQPKAAELLGRAAARMHERGQTYDKPEGERSMGRCVAAFNAVTGRDLTESEGWLLMALLKAVRAQTRTEPHQDSMDDLIAYAALYAEARGDGR